MTEIILVWPHAVSSREPCDPKMATTPARTEAFHAGAACVANFDAPLIANILRYTSPEICVRLAAVSRTWRAAAAIESHWEEWAKDTFGLTELTGAGFVPCATWKEAYASWSSLLQGLNRTHVRVALRFWSAIREATRDELPDLFQTLRPGVSWKDIHDWEARSNVRLPDVIRALYRIHDGQSTVSELESIAEAHPEGLPDADVSRVDAIWALGALGFSAVYDTVLSAHITPLTSSRSLVHGHRSRSGSGMLMLGQRIDGAKRIVVNFGDNCQIVCVSHSGCLQLVTSSGRQLALGQFGNDPAANVLAWLDELTRRLRCGYMRPNRHVRVDVDRNNVRGYQDYSGIDILPAAAHSAVAVTGCVRVRAVWAVEPALSSSPSHGGRGYCFIYQISFSHVEDDDLAVPEASPSIVTKDASEAAAQLCTRHWRVYSRARHGEADVGGSNSSGGSTAAEATCGSAASSAQAAETRERSLEVAEVRGEAVAGRFPIVRRGYKETYRSCSFGSFGDSMEGSFMFVPGTRARPRGPAFEVVCPPMRFSDPGLLF